jgi:DNA polymerase-1
MNANTKSCPSTTARCSPAGSTLDGVLEARLFKTQAERLRLFRLIATMDAKAPLPSLVNQQPTRGSAFARDLGLNQLADRLDGMP